MKLSMTKLRMQKINVPMPRGFAKLKIPKLPKNWKWVGGSRSHLDKKKKIGKSSKNKMLGGACGAT